jgi:hypothetical protein
MKANAPPREAAELRRLLAKLQADYDRFRQSSTTAKNLIEQISERIREIKGHLKEAESREQTKGRREAGRGRPARRHDRTAEAVAN